MTPEGEKPAGILPFDKMKKLIQGGKLRDNDLVNQLALIESGLSYYKNIYEICGAYEITEEELESFRQANGHLIERIKDDHRLGKFKVVQEVVGRLNLATALREAAVRQDEQSVNLIKGIIKLIQDTVPNYQIKELLSILKEVEDVPVAQNVASTSQTIVVNLSEKIKAAEALAVEKKREFLSAVKKEDAEIVEEKKAQP